MSKYSIFNSKQEAIKDGTLWGVDALRLSREDIRLLENGKVLKTDNNEYVQIIYLESEDTE